jgi:hypothetical protein
MLAPLLLTATLATAPEARPFAERPLLDVSRDRMPGFNFWDPRAEGVLWINASRESTGDGASMMLYSPDERPGVFYRAVTFGDFVRADATRNDLAEWDGISFWYKGDGTSAEGMFALDPELRTGVRFQLSSPTWRKIFLPWKLLRIDPDRQPGPFQHVVFGLHNPGRGRENYVFEDFTLVKETEELYVRRHRRETVIDDTRMVAYGEPGKITTIPRAKLDGTQAFRVSVRGNGGALRGMVYWHGRQDQAIYFPIGFDEWRHTTVTWRELPPPEIGDPLYLVFTFEPRPTAGQRYWIDRLHLYRGPALTEEIQPTPDQPRPTGVDALPFCHRPTRLLPLRERMRDLRDSRVLVVADSIGAGERLNLLSANPNASSDQSYGKRLYYLLGTQHRILKGQNLFEVFEPRERTWRTLNPPAAFSGGLTVGTFAVRGADPAFLLRAYERALPHKPDALLLQFGTAHALYRTPEEYESDLRALVARALQDGVLPILITPPPAADLEPGPDGISPLARGADLAARCRAVADQHDLPLLDAYAAFLALGETFLGEVYWDRGHFNRIGHKYFSTLAHCLLTGLPAQIWNETPENISDIIRLTPELPPRDSYVRPGGP